MHSAMLLCSRDSTTSSGRPARDDRERADRVIPAAPACSDTPRCRLPGRDSPSVAVRRGTRPRPAARARDRSSRRSRRCPAAASTALTNCTWSSAAVEIEPRQQRVDDGIERVRRAPAAAIGAARRTWSSGACRLTTERERRNDRASSQRDRASSSDASPRHVLPEYSSICRSRSSGYEIRTSVISPAASGNGFEPRLHEARVGRQVEPVDARDDLVAQRRIEVHAVRLEQRRARPRSRPRT